MANSKLLKEAIADAKAVKETALANAKLALEEAFTPRLQSILSQKMRAEAEDMEDDAEQVDEELSSDGIGSKSDAGYPQTPGANPSYDAITDLSVGVKKDSGKPEAAGTDYKKVADINEEDEFDFGGEEEDPNAAEIAELKARLAELEGEDEFGGADEFGGEEEGDPFAATEEEDPMAMAGGEDDSFGEDPMEGEEEDEMGLEAIIRELEAQLGDEEEPAMEGEEEEYEEDPNAAQIAELRRQLAELEGGEEEEPKMESKRLRESRRKLKENLADGSEAGTDKGEDPKVVVTNEGEEEDEDTVDLAEILREMEDEYGSSEEEPKAESLKKDLNEAYQTIRTLQKTINEVNLLNAKLLFANKLFRAHNMTNEQKVKVIETLDRTKSVREVKLVFSTLAENFKYTTSSNKLTKKSISEGIASKAVKSTKPAQSKAVINESVNFANRFKKLAGIIK